MPGASGWQSKFLYANSYPKRLRVRAATRPVDFGMADRLVEPAVTGRIQPASFFMMGIRRG